MSNCLLDRKTRKGVSGELGSKWGQRLHSWLLPQYGMFLLSEDCSRTKEFWMYVYNVYMSTMSTCNYRKVCTKYVFVKSHCVLEVFKCLISAWVYDQNVLHVLLLIQNWINLGGGEKVALSEKSMESKRLKAENYFLKGWPKLSNFSIWFL